MTLPELLRLDARALKGAAPGVVQDLIQAADALEAACAEIERLNAGLRLAQSSGEAWKKGWESAETRLAEIEAQNLMARQIILEHGSGVVGASPVQPSQAPERKYISPVRTVADLANNLLMMDQTLPIYGAQYIEHAGKRRCIAVSPTVSRERVEADRWIGEGDELNAAVIWTRTEQPSQALDDKQKLEIVSDWFSDKDMQSRAMQMLGDIEQATEKLNKNDTPT